MLFISKKLSYSPLIRLLNEHNLDYIDASFITFRNHPFSCPRENSYDVIFFSSPRAVDYFLAHCTVPKDKLIGCIGSSTSQHLKNKHLRVDFEGIKSGNPKEVANDFSAFVGERSVLFPQSSQSHKSMQDVLKASQVSNLVVYETIPKPIPLHKQPSIVVFTSPSNADAYLSVNTISGSEVVIAWGKTTERFLKSQGVHVSHTLEVASFESLTAFLQKHLNKR
jgi:uroporphyrinogen-III synthase